MPRIVDYPSLTQSLQDFSHRADLAPFFDYYIQLGELRIYRDILTQNFGQGIRAMEASISGSITNGVVPVPADFLALKSMQVIDSGGNVQTLEWKDAQWIYSAYPNRQGSGLPANVARDGANFVFGPFPDAGYAVSGTYYQQALGLTTSNPTTWMVTNAPDLLLAACMLTLQPFLLDDSKTSVWNALYTAALAAVLGQDSGEKWSPATMQIEPG